MALSLQDFIAQQGWNAGAVNPPQTGGNLPPLASPSVTPVNSSGYTPTANYMSQGFTQRSNSYNFDSLPSGNDMVQSSLEAMLNPNSSYIRNARQRGVEYAGSRGGLNSSIAAGAAERSAIEAAAPLAEQAVNIDVQRQQAQQRDWLESQSFNRNFMGELAMMPVKNAANMMSMVQQAALADPALYTPEVISGYSNFFNENSNQLFKRYFGGGT